MTRNFQRAILFATALFIGAFFARGPQAQSTKIDFNRDIRPILSNNCFACHGPDEQQRKAKLRLDTKDGAFAKAGVIVAGDAANSRLYKRIIHTDPNAVMPPPSTGHKLTEAQIATVKRWIDEGAQWNEHWAFVAPQRPDAPQVSNAAWVKNSIDAFVMARLDKEGLKPAPEADRATLIRRVALDLTGLPPTPAEVDAFVNDKAPDAYEKLVDRLLANQHYGERMAMQWLDLARYADTHGFHIDSHRVMWPWRDWAIKAFNSNQRFDQFTIEQLAGDLLPNASLEQRIASGFNRNHMINFEGGAIPDEYQTEYVIDRVETTANTWLGLTMGCARCHTHKYDPISHKEFYQFFAFFNNVAEVGLDGRKGNAVPLLPLPTETQKTKQAELKQAIATLEDALSDKNLAPLQTAWEKPLLGQRATTTTKDLLVHYDFDGSLADSSGRYLNARTVKGDPAFTNGMISRQLSFDAQTEVGFGNQPIFKRAQPFTLAVWMRPSFAKPDVYGLQQIADETTRRGVELLFQKTFLYDIQRWAAPLTIRLTANWPNDAIILRTKEPFYSNDYRHVTLAYDGSGKAAGLHVYLDGKLAELIVERDALAGDFANQGELVIGTKIANKGYNGSLDDLRLYSRPLEAREAYELAVNYPIQTILSGVSGKRTKEEIERLREHFLTYIASHEIKQQHLELKRLKKERTAFEETIVNTMVMKELDKPRDTFLLARGDYRNKTDKVFAATPAVLPALKTAKPERATRLDLARWLVDPSHPLTARVTVNRYWFMYFGTGLVKTTEDFGAQGEAPSNPALLDWLATEFIRTGWDVKAMQRLIVTSATYRQSSKVTPTLRERDPENRLLARGPRFRLAAELVRDNALAVSGLLNQTIGGASVKPYHPSGLWEEMAFGDGFTEQAYTQAHGADLYRRTMYTFWKRTVPPPTLASFDAPDREKCTGRRPLTNTPLQALITMNDPTYVEAARALATRTLRDGGKTMDMRLGFAFKLATSRKPTANELAVLRGLVTQQLAAYRANPTAADALLKVGESALDAKIDKIELAAWTMVASTILNLDEVITKE